MAQAVSVILSLIIIKKRKLPFEFHKEDICFNVEIKNFTILGAPIAKVFGILINTVFFLYLMKNENK